MWKDKVKGDRLDTTFNELAHKIQAGSIEVIREVEDEAGSSADDQSLSDDPLNMKRSKRLKTETDEVTSDPDIQEQSDTKRSEPYSLEDLIENKIRNHERLLDDSGKLKSRGFKVEQFA